MKQTEEIPYIPVQTGEVFLQDKIVDDTHCYICKKEFNKFDDKDMLLLRVKEHEMGFCCSQHKGIVASFIEQYRMLPGDWEVWSEKNNNDPVVDSVDSPNSISSK